MDLRETVSIKELNDHNAPSAAGQSGIHIVTIGKDWVEASMPINAKTCGLDGALNLGSLALLAETVGSVASAISVDRQRFACVGQTLQVYQLAPAVSGPVLAKATPVELGIDRHIWQIDIIDARRTSVANAKLVTVILPKESVT